MSLMALDRLRDRLLFDSSTDVDDIVGDDTKADPAFHSDEALVAAGGTERSRGIAKQAALKDQALSWPVGLTRAEILVREGRAEPATSVRGATHNQVVSRARSGRPARAGWAALRHRFTIFRFGANADAAAAAPAARWEVRGHAKQAALKDQALSGPRRPYSRRILVREGRAEPATSVSRATHIQVVSRATRDQADPLAPAGRRFASFLRYSALGRTLMRPPRRRARAGRYGVIAKHAALKDQRFGPRRPYSRQFLAREGRAEPATSVSRATHNQVVSRGPRSGRPARAGWAALRLSFYDIPLWGERWCGRRGAGRALGGTGSWKTRGIERSAFRAPLTLLAPNPRARGARRASDVGQRSDPHSGGQQSDRDQADPLAPAGRRFAIRFCDIPLWGERWCGRRGAGRALGGTGSSQNRRH